MQRRQSLVEEDTVDCRFAANNSKNSGASI